MAGADKKQQQPAKKANGDDQSKKKDGEASKSSGSTSAETKPVIPLPADQQLLALLRQNISLLQRTITNVEPRFTARVIRSLPATRSRIQQHPHILKQVITQEATPTDSPLRAQLAALIQSTNPPAAAKSGGDAMDVDAAAPASSSSASGPAPTQVLPPAPSLSNETQFQVDAYLRLLVLIHLVDRHAYTEALQLARVSIDTVLGLNKRSLDQIGARTVFWLGRALELREDSTSSTQQEGQSGLAAERTYLLSLHRTASLRHDVEVQATLLNLLLRSYIVSSNPPLFDQADKLVARAPFPKASATNSQIARYEYYVGRIRAVQLNYSEAHANFQQAIRRAPQLASLQQQYLQEKAKKASAAAAAADEDVKMASDVKDADVHQPVSLPPASGFLQTAYKFLIIVELLMGDIPERTIFRSEILRPALAPYMPIVQAVRTGNLALFQQTLQTHAPQFQADRTYSLILRLRFNVIKTGIRMISLAYSRISLKDITQKLNLESEEDAEYIVAKAIRDGVVGTTVGGGATARAAGGAAGSGWAGLGGGSRVDHELGIMETREGGDVYASDEPQAQLQQRIDFCLQIHNESVKAMRYPLNTHKAELDSAVAARERERELAQEIAEGGDLDEEDDDWV
ncbi:26S proteasome non-ATPase regulatory subunit [Tilletia horrida]|nr:26S proteasome non-ATPase regulatory subunit [Tilletia horrida]KAK0563111.1 26S proteasome non-ATPase regulatory subunit [Tilletia horrida]